MTLHLPERAMLLWVFIGEDQRYEGRRALRHIPASAFGTRIAAGQLSTEREYQRPAEA